MKFNKKLLRRILSVMAAVVILISSTCFGLTASASEVYNYLDFLTNVQVNEDFNIVTVRLPCFSSRFDIYGGYGGDSSQHAFSSSFTTDFVNFKDNEYPYDIQISPSWDGKTANFIDLSNLPSDTEINVWISIDSRYPGSGSTTTGDPVIPEWGFTWVTSGARFHYMDKDFKRVGTTMGQFGVFDPAGSDGNPEDSSTLFLSLGLLSYPSNAAYFYPVFYLNDCRFEYDTTLTMSVTNYELVFHIDTLVAGGQHGQLLDEINDKLSEQGKYIDPETGDIVPIPPKETIPAPDMDSVHDEIEDFKDQIAVTYPDFDDLDTDLADLVNYDTFLLYAGSFFALWKNDTLVTFFIIIFTFVIISYFFFGKKG